MFCWLFLNCPCIRYISSNGGDTKPCHELCKQDLCRSFHVLASLEFRCFRRWFLWYASLNLLHISWSCTADGSIMYSSKNSCTVLGETKLPSSVMQSYYIVGIILFYEYNICLIPVFDVDICVLSCIMDTLNKWIVEINKLILAAQ